MPTTDPTDARRKARYGHRDWLVWLDTHGARHARPLDAATLKAAMLATGTRGHFTLYEATTGNPWRVTWPHAVAMLANAKRGYL